MLKAAQSTLRQGDSLAQPAVLVVMYLQYTVCVVWD
jgi:hypothetical protein